MSGQAGVQSPAAGAWHATPAENAFERLRSAERGLTSEEAARRLAGYGPNALPSPGGHEALQILVRQIRDPLVYVLLGSTGLAILTGKVFDGLVIFGVILLNTLIGFVQEFRASRAIRSLSAMVRGEATALRDGRTVPLPSSELVPGDVVLLHPGDKVPADVRLIEVRGLRTEEAALTGESVPADKSLATVEEEAGIGDRRNMAYSGTLVVAGEARGLVVATGPATELGRISQMLEEAGTLETPLTRQLGVVGRWIAAAVVVVSVVLLGVGLVRGYPLGDAVVAAVALAVAAIPEGLPAIVTIALAIGVQRMAGRRAIVRSLPAVETLGATTVICSDKTGTLTRNEMTVQLLRTPVADYRLTGVGYRPDGALHDADGKTLERPPEDVRALVQAGVLCSNAELHGDEGDWSATGDPTEAALVVAGRKLGLQPDELRAAFRRLDAIPFGSDRQYMATLHQRPDGGRLVYIKGAPEVIQKRCETPAVNGGASPDDVSEAVERIAAKGMRVLAFAVREVSGYAFPLEGGDVRGGFTFLGLQAMIDPARPEALEAVRACQRAGIVVKMITGDHPATARAIGEELGVLGPGEPALTGPELSRMEPAEIRAAAARHHVFARVAPEHKLHLLRALQADRHVAAMTGDGVNDAPALKQADIGIAMGITGTAVAKEAADMILTDDNFATIRAAVEEGRRVYDNLVKALAFVLPTNLGLAFILTAAVMFFPVVDGRPLLPMSPVQILWINLVAAVGLALPLAFEAMEPDLMCRPPRAPGTALMSGFVVGRTVLVAVLMAGGALGLFLVEYGAVAGRGRPPAYAEGQTQAVTTVILFQIFYLLKCRSLKDSVLAIGLWSNRWVYVGIGTVLALHLGFVYLPFMNAVFGSAPLRPLSWLEAVVVASVILPVIGVEKQWRKLRRSG